ncbi:hypothetical protein BRM70_03695, partial [Xanthomonas oryzae pv. oryzae]
SRRIASTASRLDAGKPCRALRSCRMFKPTRTALSISTEARSLNVPSTRYTPLARVGPSSGCETM